MASYARGGLIALGLMTVGPAASAAEPVNVGGTVAIELAGIAGPGAGGGVASARLLLDLPWLSAEVWAGEGYLAGVDRQAGRLGVGLRRYLWQGSYVRAGFAHAHEVPVDTFARHVAGSLAGTHDGILHRSGVELGAGWAIEVARTGPRVGWAVTVDVSGQLYPGPVRPLGTAQIGVGVAGVFGLPQPGTWTRPVATLRDTASRRPDASLPADPPRG
ncbi:MAG: hypothetical protein H6733_12140 [Alphaproteobacteria bacterium]|nr:hypothetical protein [Alphaproteobacteria bacterium]